MASVLDNPPDLPDDDRIYLPGRMLFETKDAQGPESRNPCLTVQEFHDQVFPAHLEAWRQKINELLIGSATSLKSGTSTPIIDFRDDDKIIYLQLVEEYRAAGWIVNIAERQVGNVLRSQLVFSLPEAYRSRYV